MGSSKTNASNKTTRQQRLKSLVALIELHLLLQEESETGFGRRLARDPNLVRDLKGGRWPGLKMRKRLSIELGGVYKEVDEEQQYSVSIRQARGKQHG